MTELPNFAKLDSVDALKRIEENQIRQAQAEAEMMNGVDALGFLRHVYRDPLQPTGVRLRAAQIAIEYERPRLAMTALVDGADFRARLERAIARSRSEPKVIEHPPAVAVDHRPTLPTPDRRFRRI